MNRAVLGREIQAALVCYTESVVHQEWPEIADGDRAAGVSVWTVALAELIGRIDPSDPESRASSRNAHASSRRTSPPIFPTSSCRATTMEYVADSGVASTTGSIRGAVSGVR
jgi:hypothetical protein